jgi:hypothetical protein
VVSGPATCPTCGRSLDAHDRHVRFQLPDPVLDVPAEQREARTWRNDVMMQVQGVGAFVRALLPVRLSAGHRVTFGVWLGVPPDELQRAFREWWTPTYVDLVLDGFLANDVRPWGLLAKPARAVVRDPDHTPYVDSSDDDLLRQVLTDEWPHDYVLGALPA